MLHVSTSFNKMAHSTTQIWPGGFSQTISWSSMISKGLVHRGLDVHRNEASPGNSVGLLKGKVPPRIHEHICLPDGASAVSADVGKSLNFRSASGTRPKRVMNIPYGSSQSQELLMV